MMTKTKLTLVALVVLLGIEPLSAMHIMEGYLPLGWCAFWYAVSLPFLVISYRHIRQLIEREPRQRIIFSLNTAFVFILSALKLPSVTGSSSHLTGTTLGTLTSGPMSMPLVGLVVLIFQSLILAHGGISTLGANVFSLAIAGPLVAYAIYSALMRLRLGETLSIALVAFIGSLATYVTTSIQLAVVFPDSIQGMWGSFVKFISIFAVTQVPLSALEAVLTVLVIRLIKRMSTESISPGLASPGSTRSLLLGLGALVCLALPIMAGYVDFGEGTDNAAGSMVEQLHPSYEPHPFFETFEPSEALEPWLFTLQVAVGIGLFVWAYRAFARLRATD